MGVRRTDPGGGSSSTSGSSRMPADAKAAAPRVDEGRGRDDEQRGSSQASKWWSEPEGSREAAGQQVVSGGAQTIVCGARGYVSSRDGDGFEN
jgi:hypothetical protein